MNITIDVGKIITALILALLMYIGNTVHELQINQNLQEYKLEQTNYVLQDLYETKREIIKKD
jgi:hypothetical protein